MSTAIKYFNLSAAEISQQLQGLCPDDAETPEYFARAAWSFIAEPGDPVAGQLVQSVGAVRALEWLLGNADLEVELGKNEQRQLAKHQATWNSRLDYHLLSRALQTARGVGAKLILPLRNFDRLQNRRPFILWVKGNLSALKDDRTMVSVVGTRSCSYYGKAVTSDIVYGLVRKGYTIVSGGAIGIDGMAHRCAIAAAAKTAMSPQATVAFFAGGIDYLYPQGNENLFASISEHGALVSEVACGARPTRWRFLQRNRLIAAAGSAVVVTEAAKRSGSINTACQAAALGVPVGAVPGAVNSALSQGCNQLIRNGQAVIVSRAEEVEELFVPLDATREQQLVFDPDELNRIRVFDALSKSKARDLYEICRLSGLLLEEVKSIIGLAQLSGQVVRTEVGWLLPRRSGRR